MRFALTLALLALQLTACSPPSAPTLEFSGDAMGTSYSVRIVAANPPGDALAAALGEGIDELEQLASTWIADSDVSRFNADSRTDWFPVDPDVCELVALAGNISRRTGGAFDITVGPLVELWGFGSGGSRSAPPAAAEIDALRPHTGHAKVTADCARPAIRKSHPSVRIDLSAIAKGFAADRLASTLDAAGIGRYLVEVGGELKLKGLNAENKPWAIAIEKPLADRRTVQAVVNVTDRGMATSGDYRNFFEVDGQRYSHTIDPRTGHPVTHAAASVSVIADTAAGADALATALLVLGPEEGMALAKREGIDAYFLLRNKDAIDATMTDGFAALLPP